MITCWVLPFKPSKVQDSWQFIGLNQCCQYIGSCSFASLSPCCHWSIAPEGCGKSTATDISSQVSHHMWGILPGVSSYLLQGHSGPSTSLSNPCAHLLLNDVMSCFSWLGLRCIRWQTDITFPNETIIFPLSRNTHLHSLLVALSGRQEGKECGHHFKGFYYIIVVITTWEDRIRG